MIALDTQLMYFKDIFENVNRWLFFSEAKNASLVAFNLAVLTIAAEQLDVARCNLFQIIFCLSSVLLLISLSISMFSFCPQTNLKRLTEVPKKAGNNALYYAQIASWDGLSYAQHILHLYFDEPASVTPAKILIDYAEEIVTNSRITYRKDCLFRIALHISLLALLALGLVFLFSALITVHSSFCPCCK